MSFYLLESLNNYQNAARGAGCRGLIPCQISNKKDDVPFFLTTQCVSDAASFTSICNLILTEDVDKNLQRLYFYKYVCVVCTSRKSRKFEYAGRERSPTRLKIERGLGISLAQILFDYSHQEAVKLLKSLPLTIISQPSCCASQNGALVDVKKQTILKSYIHNDILALGEGELKKFQIEIEAATQKNLKDEFAKECHMLEAEKRFAISRNADEIHAKYEEYFKFAQQELEEKLQIELADENAKRNKELQKAVVKARMDTTHDVLRKIRPQMNWIVTSLYNELEQTRRAQKEKMIADFNIIMRNQYLKLDARIKEIERQKMEELRIQRHELEIRNVTNIIYIFCLERLRSGSRLQAIYKHFEEKVKSLHELIAKQEETMNTMRKKITKYRNKNKTLQEKINDLTKEFQKFINFAFDSLPEHADFLLPLNLLSVNSANEEDSEHEKKQQAN